MRCHYEILGISMDSTTEDVKRAYRKLALEWHPDKNLHQLQEATEQFQLIQQAYDVLSDSHERAWYDRHRDEILKGGLDDDYRDNSLDVFQYFNTSCFSGYGYDDKSFYTVYQNVFDQIAAEDKPFMEEDIEIPRFGTSDSAYDEVVHPFYSYWQSYCTQKPFFWIDKYDIRDAPNRRVLRLIEKENKKVRDQAKKIRNEEVRHLVEYVRKRDKRVQAYKIILEKKAAENTRKMEQERKRQILERQKNFENYKETEWASMSQLEKNLQEIEAQLDKEFGRESNEKANYEENYSSSNSDGEEKDDDLYCAACDKAFRSDKAFINHERSKKHKQNVTMLKEIMKDEEQYFAKEDAEIIIDTTEEQTESFLATDLVIEHEDPTCRKGKKKKQKKIRLKNNKHSDQDEMAETAELIKQPDLLENAAVNSSVNVESKENENMEDGDEMKNKKSKGQKKPSKSSSKETRSQQSDQEEMAETAELTKQPNLIEDSVNSSVNVESKENENVEERNLFCSGNGMKNKKSKGQKKASKSSSKETGSQVTCFCCHTEFISRNKLFEHLKSTGHALYISSESNKEESKYGLQEKPKSHQRRGKR